VTGDAMGVYARQKVGGLSFGSLGWREARYEEPEIRITLVLVGICGAVLFGWMLARLLMRLRGKGAELQVSGPKDRVLFQLQTGLICIFLFLIMMGALGSAFMAHVGEFLTSLGIVLAFLSLWGWIEYSYAKPGLLVIPEARRIAGARSGQRK